MYQWTTEAVSKGHPDKVADQISDSILDAYLKIDPNLHVACECMVMKDLVVVSGEVSPCDKIDTEAVVRRVLCDIGYDDPVREYDGNTIEILDGINVQSQEIANAVVKKDGDIGAGDQGIMFGYATDETDSFMPLAHHLAFRFINALEEDIASKRQEAHWGSIFLPDSKSQVTINYTDDGKPLSIATIVVSTQHRRDVSLSELREYVHDEIIPPIAEDFGELFNDETKFLINPSGAWHFGGPAADTGLTGRKIVVDNYGGDCPIGGGAFSGKDPTKVDRSAAYAARYIAKNLVASGIANKVTIQLSYAIGVSQPTSVRVITPRNRDSYIGIPAIKNIHLASSTKTDADIGDMIQELVDLSPCGIIERFNLRSPIYARTASGGHFGNADYPWEKLDLDFSDQFV
jgi:S-adenosylmethionine synthetase